ncbi:MAG: DUF2254 family protein [Sandaracinaceae bacterium]
MALALEQGMRRRIWVYPLALLLGITLTVFGVSLAFDVALHGDGLAGFRDLWSDLANRTTVSALDNAAEVVAAVLGIAITVVAIVVELAANRYTHRITELFVAEPTNSIVMGFFVITALQCIAVSVVFPPDAALSVTGTVGSAVSMTMLALSLLILLPYFSYVFSFLNPISIVHRIRRHTLDVIASRSARMDVVKKQSEAVRGIEQLADVALNAMEHKDKGVSMASVDALKTMVIDYQPIRKGLGARWFEVEGDLAVNPDFVSMAPSVLAGVTGRKIWLEMKVLRQYQTLYNEALNRMRDMNYLIAINTRRIAEAGLGAGNTELFYLAVKFFNTYLRATVNAKDVRTAYNVLNQYRLLAETCLQRREGEKAVELARYFKYYGGVSFHAKLPFILETVAYDLCALNEMADDLGDPEARHLLRIFLQVDRESETEVQETSLRGVRKAQVKLATFYLLRSKGHLAREVFKDMAGERPERLASIRNELMAIESPEFWEISDRGVNFDYFSDERKQKMVEFFEWFGNRIPPPPTRPSGEFHPSTIPASSSAGTDRAREAEDWSGGPGTGGDPGRDTNPEDALEAEVGRVEPTSTV